MADISYIDTKTFLDQIIKNGWRFTIQYLDEKYTVTLYQYVTNVKVTTISDQFEIACYQAFIKHLPLNKSIMY